MDKLVADYLRPWKDALPALYDWSFDHERAASEFGLSFEGGHPVRQNIGVEIGIASTG